MMPELKYRKLPVEVEAVQWFKAGDHPKVQGFSGQHCIGTLEGWMKVSPGDWIITGVKGECYPCKPDIFALTYEPAPRPDGGDSLREALRIIPFTEKPTIGDLPVLPDGSLWGELVYSKDIENAKRHGAIGYLKAGAIAKAALAAKDGG